MSIGKNISEEKFSSLEIYDNGVKIGVTLPTSDPDTVRKQNVYLRKEDVAKLVLLGYNILNEEEEDNSSYNESNNDDGIEDAVY